MREVWLLQHRLEEQKAENQKLKQRNEALAAEVQDLKSGKAAIEERARSEQGLIKPGEVFYQVVEPAPGARRPTMATNNSALWCVVPAAGQSTRLGGEI